MNRCAKFEDIIARYVHDGALLPEKEDLERHIAVCASCEALYRGIVDADRLLRELPGKQVEPPPFLRARILANLPDAAPGGARFAWARWLSLAGGAACALVAGLLVYHGQTARTTRTAATPAAQGNAGATAAAPKAAAPKAPAPGRVVAKADTGTEATAPRKPVAAAPRVQIIREVKIYFYCPPAQKVAVTGDFNGWDPAGVALRQSGKPGLWTASLRLKPGAYSYNFIVDGDVLVPDPNAPAQAPDGYGGTNSILLVKEEKPA